MMKKIIILFLGWMALLLIVNKLSINFINDKTSYELPSGTTSSARFTLLPFLNFDGRNYLDIARAGYFEKDGHNLNVFFPVYPFLIRTISLNGVLNPIYVGILISISSLLAVLFIFNKMFGLKATTLILAFPTSFFFTAYYTESIFLLFVLLFFFFINKKNYLAASVFAAFASGTRVMGVVLTAILLYEIIKDKKDIKKHLWKVLIAPLGFVFYFLNYGTSIISAQVDWNRQVGILGPFRALSDSVSHILKGPLTSYDNIFVYPIIVLEFFIFALAVFVYTF